MVFPLRRSSWKKNFTGEEKFTLGEFTAVNMKIVAVAMLGNTDRSRVGISTSPGTSH